MIMLDLICQPYRYNVSLYSKKGFKVNIVIIFLQALQRKHEGLERDLAALGERVHSLDADASRLTDQHPEQRDAIQIKRSEINQAWNDLVEKVIPIFN